MLKIEIVKRPDGAGVLRCTRADGSVSWQKQAKHGAHFALHDLTHYAVETTLGCRQGFFGLVSQGWEFNEHAPRRLSRQEIQNVRALRSSLFQQWFATAAGQSLELTFAPVTAAPSGSRLYRGL